MLTRNTTEHDNGDMSGDLANNDSRLDEILTIVRNLSTHVEVIESKQNSVEQGVINLGVRVEAIESKQNNIEQGITNLGVRVEAIERKQNSIEQGIINLGVRVEAIENRQGNIEQGIINLGVRVEALEKELEDRNSQQVIYLKSIDDGLKVMRADMDKGFRTIDRQIGELSHDIVRLRADHGDALSRIEHLEEKAS
jgi:chromosome segregation ATPase